MVLLRPKSNLRLAFADLYRAGFGIDTWAAFYEGREIVAPYFPANTDIEIQWRLMQSASKNGEFKDIRKNHDSFQKGGKRRKKCRALPPCPDDIKKYIEGFRSEILAARQTWIRKSTGFQELQQKFPDIHKGLLICWVDNHYKDVRINQPGTYIMEHEFRPEYIKVGKTKRDPKSRLRDGGSFSRFWKLKAFYPDVEEISVHKVLDPWRDMNGCGTELFKIDDNAKEALWVKLNIVYPGYTPKGYLSGEVPFDQL